MEVLMSSLGSGWRAFAHWNLQKPGYAIAVYVGALGAAFLGFGVLLFPWPQVSPRPERLSIDVESNGNHAVAGVDIGARRLSDLTYRVTVVVWLDPAEGNNPNDPEIEIILPDGQQFVHRPDARRIGTAWLIDPTVHAVPGDEGVLRSKLVAEITGAEFGYDFRGEHVVAVRPAIAGSVNTDTPLTVTYGIDNLKELEWQQNPPDSSTPKTATWDYTWTKDAAPESTAVNVAESGSSQFRGFLAAAFFALGGSALFVIIPEWMKQFAAGRKAAQSRSAR
jgi:hypothetical protein